MGTFGSFTIGTGNAPPESNDKRPGFGSGRGSSRFKDMLQSKTSTEDMAQVNKDKGLFGALEKLPEEAPDISQARLRDEFKTRPGRSETNPYEEGLGRTGSAALGGSQEAGPVPAGIEQMGMSAFGPHTSIGGRNLGHDEAFQQTPHGRYSSHEPMSPTNTNPYQSPHGRVEDEERENNDPTLQSSALPPFGGTARRSLYSSADEGRQSASGLRSVSGLGGIPGLPGFGGNPMWSAAGVGSGKPAMDRGFPSAFGDTMFNPLPELHSPAGLGGGFGGFGAGRASRLGAMLPAAMQQDQPRGDSRHETGLYDSRPDSAQQHPAHDPFDGISRRPDDFTRGSGLFEDSPAMQNVEEPGNGPFGFPGSGLPTSSASMTGVGPQTAGPRVSGSDQYQSGQGRSQSQSSGSNSSNQLPTTQQRQMVMPDRMRWIYRDPQGHTQGPWSGLEMHDWFKAGFFTAELQVKKLEDIDFEPLAQLVRRIGNSREPFLVPQIGVPHGPANAAPGNTWANPTMPPPTSAGPAQPPFANNFPSFGTTLTAEQQNALERRKQEEQYLMARQKEHLAQQQMAMKMQMQNGMHSLQHHSSAHSLHSQPSFGSITSPTGYQPSPIQPMTQPQQQQQPMPFGHPAGPSAGPAFGRDDDIHTMVDRLSFSQRAGNPFTSAPLGPPPPEGGPSSQQINNMFHDRGRLQQQQQQTDMRGHQDAFLGQQGRNERLEEFHTLCGQTDIPTGRLGPEEPIQQPIGAPRQMSEQPPLPVPSKFPVPIGHQPVIAKPQPESLSLAQQVQIVAASQQAQIDESEWTKIDTPIDPPPVSISPLPAPAAQRNRLHVADQLAGQSRSATQTPVETSVLSIAPWAERGVDHAKGPSLKQIQEAEAKRAAEQEVIAAAARRAQAEQERLNQTQAPAPAPGLPSSSTWGSTVSPVTPSTQAASVWAKQTPAKAGPTSSAGVKKTLAQIQKEEESRKQRVAIAQAAANAQSATSSVSNAVGKRYAELASKAVPAVPTTTGGAWTTVGIGGKTKAPPAIVATPQPVARTVSTSTAPKSRPGLQTVRSTSLASQSKANEEFSRWIKGALGKGLNSGINRKSLFEQRCVLRSILTYDVVDNFVQDLLQLPPEVEIISDSVYASSQTLDGRRFAEEFVRRRKLADKGVVESATGAQAMMGIGGGVDPKSTSATGGGWSEVAKKGPANVGATKEDANTQFKVVPTKKKGKR